MYRLIVIILSMASSLYLAALSVDAARNPDITITGSISGSKAVSPYDIETEFSVVCDVGSVSNFITNDTFDHLTGTNEWTILIGNSSLEYPSMKWTVPDIYPYNNYLYYASLRIGQGERLVRLSTDTSPGGETYEGPDAISDFDTHFYISDQSDLVPPEERIGIRVHENTFAWSAADADDFITYEFWIVNLNDIPLSSIYVALHSDCDVSSAAGGSGVEGYWRDDLPGYYRDDNAGEFISYMYDADCPAIPGNDMGGRFDPKESLGYIGSRLLYCPPVMGDNRPTIQQGHGWWDWNSDPEDESDWMRLMSDGLWLDPPPSPHDFRFLQKLGPFEIAANDSIRVVFAFGIGNGLTGLRSNLNNARLLFDNGYAYFDLPPDVPMGFAAEIVNNDIEFSWQPVDMDDLSGYNIYSSVDPEGPFTVINQFPIDTTFYSYSPPDRAYYYLYLASEDLAGNESISTDTIVVSTLPRPPGDFRAIPGDNSVQLNWEIMDGASAYRIYRSMESGGPYIQIAEIDHPQNSFTDNNVSNYQTYYYVATTIADGYESPYTGEVEVTPDPNLTGRVLLVDDYQEIDNSGNPLPFQERRRFYERWGTYNFDYDLWVIADQGMPGLSTLQNYQAVVFASDGHDGNTDGTWWYEVGSVGGGVLADYLEGGGKLLAVGQLVLLDLTQEYPPDPQPGDFEYDWFGVDSGLWAWDYWYSMTWAIGAEPGYPDSMKIDVAKLPDQVDYACEIDFLRNGVDTLFLWGLDIEGSEPQPYLSPVGIIYRPDGTAVSSLLSLGLYYMPGEDVLLTISNILRDEFGCTFYTNPAPLPPWHAGVTAIIGDGLLLSWDAIDERDIIAINIYRSRDGSPYDLLTSLDRGAGQYIDSDIIPGSSYAYKLTCVDLAGQEGEFSQEISEIGGRPAPPENLVAEPGDSEVTLRWHIPDDPGVANFKVYRCIGAPGDFIEIATVPGSESTYVDSDIVNRNIYNYNVTSISDFDVESYPSDTAFAFPHAPERIGILVVNGIDWPTYGLDVIRLYQNHSFTGSFPYRFWDLFENTPIDEFPDPQFILGQGDLPPVFFDAFQTIIWAGNNYGGDFEVWEYNRAHIINFLNTGGNMILPVRYGSDWFFDELAEYCGIVPNSWDSPSSDDLTARQDSLTNIRQISSQSLWEIPTTDNPDNIWIYEAADVAPGKHAGFITLPDGIGGGGGFCYIAGRPYRWNNDDLRYNFEVILRYYFQQSMTDIDDRDITLPDEFTLYQNYPNPFNPSTSIKFGLPVRSDIRLEIYDILGRSVAVLLDGSLDAGYHEIVWNGKDKSGGIVSSGVYFFRLRAGDFVSAKKMLMLK